MHYDVMFRSTDSSETTSGRVDSNTSEDNYFVLDECSTVVAINESIATFDLDNANAAREFTVASHIDERIHQMKNYKEDDIG